MLMWAPKSLTTNTYSTIPSYLQKKNKTHLMKDLIKKAGSIAREVADANNQEFWLLVVCHLSMKVIDLIWCQMKKTPYLFIKSSLTNLILLLIFFYCETVSSIAETSNILKALKNNATQDKKIWLSWTLLEDKSGRLRSKETIEDAFQFAESFNPDAYLFNCTDPIAITEGIKKLSKLTDKPIGCYPNVFGVPFDWTLDNDIQVEPRILSVKQFVEYKNLWEDLGASIIGGCCGLGPDYIEAIS